MGKLLKFEFRKLFQNKAFYICIAVSVLMFIITTVTYVIMNDALKTMAEETGTPMPSTTYTSMSLLKSYYSSGSVSVVSAVMVVILSSEDYTNDITKNIYSKGFSREKLFLSKYIVVLVSIVIMMIVGMLVGFISGLFIDGVGTAGENFVPSIIAIIIVAIAYCSLFFGISLLFKKTGSSIAVAIIAPTTITLLLALADTFIKNDNFKFSEYWLDYRLVELSYQDVSNKAVIGAIIVALVLMIPMVIVPFLINRKRDN